MSLLSRLAVQAARAYGMLARVGAPTSLSADYLVVAGGGGGGNSGGSTYGTTSGGGGGGAGGLTTSTFTLSTANTYTIVVGAGGSASGYSKGINSTISGTGLTTVTAFGGGLGGTAYYYNDMNGGSGGGAAYSTSAGTGTAGQGNNGATYTAGFEAGGGGGGAGAVGTTNTSNNGGAGGNGSASSISGSSVTYAGGGGGGSGFSSGGLGAAGGSGGGGAGGNRNTVGTAGTANLGGGGGGAGGMDPAGAVRAGGNGGSGIVIISYTSATPKFVGGTITTSGGKQIHTFTSSGTLSPITPITASYLVVAGGGGGGYSGAGGGAGGLLTSSTTLYSGATYVVTVGAGGTGATYTASRNGNAGGNGSNSVVSGTGLTTLTSTGGGGGGSDSSTSGQKNGQNGGSGGGAGEYAGVGTVGTGTSGQGNNGGTAFATNGESGGGGGAGGAGGNASSGQAGNGGAGTTSSISGSSVGYAGGGAGGRGGYGTATSGGGSASSGTANLGGGGSGGANAVSGFNGGSGIVIISYAGSQQFNGGLVTSSGGNTIHTFTSTGALTPLTNNLNNSLRFRASASAYLSRTPASASNRKTWTWSGWVKKAPIQGSANTLATLMGCTTGSTDSTYLRFGFYQDKFIVGNNSAFFLQSTPLYRDPSAWYHVVVSTDTNQGSASNRMRIYINGNEVTAWSTDQRSTYLTSSVDLAFNQASQHSIGSSLPNAGDYFDGYMTDINFIDGQALEPYYFGNNDANGVWKPIQYKGTYGTNGFYLNFADTSALTTSSNAGLGKDTSGNGNYWTTNNISITSGSTYDPMLDVPTNTSATVANYCVLNPLAKRRTVTQVATFSEANLKATFPNAAGNSTFAIGTFGVTSGKWYWEIPVVTRATELVIGIGNTGTLDETNGGAGYQATNGAISGFTTNPPAGASYTSGDIIGVALDVDAGTCAFYKNNSLQGTGTGLLSTPQPWVQGNTNDVINANFGQRPFTYTPPTGYVALNTYNLPTPTILQGNKYMDATLYTGNGSTQVVVNNAQFKPDFVWVKTRNVATTDHCLFDAVRGVSKYLNSNNTGAEATYTGFGTTAFNSNGFTVVDNAGGGYLVNGSTGSPTYVGWQWQAGQGTTSSNTSGSITSTVSVNTTAGFSVATFTLPASGTFTVGHGLGVAPAMMILKCRGTAGTNWVIYHQSLGNTKWISLNLTNAATTDTTWNNTSPTSTVFTGNTVYLGNSLTYVSYCWAEIAGFSRFSSYTGNGSADGPFVFTNFKPKYILVKSTGTASWFVIDTARLGYNSTNNYLLPNASTAETTYNGVDILSNGFKVRNTDSGYNDSGVTYIYAAFAENPFKNANAR